MKQVIFILCIILLYTNCNNDDSNTTLIEFSLIGHGVLNGDGAEGISKSNLIVNDSSSWNDLLTQMNSVNNVSDNFTEIDIDFNKHIIIAVFDQIYGNGGHSIDVTSITANDVEMIVKVENLLKGDVSSVIIQPFHIVKIPKTEKQISFE